MLKKYLVLRFPDANQIEGGSGGDAGASSETFRTAGEQPNELAGEMGASGTSGSELGSGQDESGNHETLLDAVKKVADKHKGKGGEQSDSSSDDEHEQESGSDSEQDSGEKPEGDEEQDEQQGSEGEEGSDKGEGEQSESKEDDKNESDDKNKTGDKNKVPEEKLLSGKNPVPVERFKEVIDQRNNVRQQLEVVKPKVENYDKITSFCQQHNVSPEQFKTALEIQALLNTNPAEALKRIEPIVEQLKGFTGDKLPSDLQKAVDDGEISLKYAKEVASSRAQSQFGQRKTEFDQQQLVRQQQQMLQQRLAESAQSWETAKRKADIDYVPKKNESDPDGKWEMVRDKFLAKLNATDAQGNLANPVRTPEEMIALMEKSYSEVSQSFKRFTTRQPTKKILRSDGSSKANGNGKAKSVEEAGSLQEAVSIGLKQAGHRF